MKMESQNYTSNITIGSTLDRMKYSRSFYLQDTFVVARALLGSILHSRIDKEEVSGRIVEVEAYLGGSDWASHAYPMKVTPRTQIMFGPGGFSYVFLVYGMHSQFCVVTGPKYVPDVVLIRAVEPVEGIDIMKRRRRTDDLGNLTNGPGKVCSAMGITKSHYGKDLCGDELWIAQPDALLRETDIAAGKRIGIDYAGDYAEKPWRFYMKGNRFVSR